jgi:heterodisulfide reductase subunit C
VASVIVVHDSWQRKGCKKVGVCWGFCPEASYTSLPSRNKLGELENAQLDAELPVLLQTQRKNK